MSGKKPARPPVELEGQSSLPDPDAISAEALPPSPEDDRVNLETKGSGKFGTKTPTDRLEEYKDAHILAIDSHARLHIVECGRLRGALEECHRDKESLCEVLRKRIEADQSAMADLKVRIARHEELSWTINWMSLTGTILAVMGGIVVGIAGSWPSGDDFKKSFTAFGTAAAICGAVMLIMSQFAGKRARKI